MQLENLALIAAKIMQPYISGEYVSRPSLRVLKLLGESNVGQFILEILFCDKGRFCPMSHDSISEDPLEIWLHMMHNI